MWLCSPRGFWKEMSGEIPPAHRPWLHRWRQRGPSTTNHSCELPFSPVTRGSQHIPGEMEPAGRLILMPYSLPSLSPSLGWRPHLFLLFWALLPFCFPFSVEEWPLAQQDSPKQHGFSRHGAVSTLNRTLPAALACTASACLAPVEVSDSQRPDWSRGKGHSPTPEAHRASPPRMSVPRNCGLGLPASYPAGKAMPGAGEGPTGSGPALTPSGLGDTGESQSQEVSPTSQQLEQCQAPNNRPPPLIPGRPVLRGGCPGNLLFLVQERKRTPGPDAQKPHPDRGHKPDSYRPAPTHRSTRRALFKGRVFLSGPWNGPKSAGLSPQGEGVGTARPRPQHTQGGRRGGVCQPRSVFGAQRL